VGAGGVGRAEAQVAGGERDRVAVDDVVRAGNGDAGEGQVGEVVGAVRVEDRGERQIDVGLAGHRRAAGGPVGRVAPQKVAARAAPGVGGRSQAVLKVLDAGPAGDSAAGGTTPSSRRNGPGYAASEPPGNLVCRMNPRSRSGRCFAVINSSTT